MNSVERVKLLCKERKIPISRLEKELGFSNGYINQLRKGTFPSDRLLKIAAYLDVPVNYLACGQEETKAPTPQDEISPNSDNSARLLSEIMNLAKELSEIEQDYILDMIRTFQSHRETLIEQKTK